MSVTLVRLELCVGLWQENATNISHLKKLTKFLTMTFRSYNVPKVEIDKTIAFVLSLDIRGISESIMQKLFDLLAIQFNFEFSAIGK